MSYYEIIIFEYVTLKTFEKKIYLMTLCCYLFSSDLLKAIMEFAPSTKFTFDDKKM